MGIEELQSHDHDPNLLYKANSAERMLRWPIFQKVTTESERQVRSFLLDSIDNLPQAGGQMPGVMDFNGDDIIPLCKKYMDLNQMRNPIVEPENLLRYAREVVAGGGFFGWNGPSCQVVRIFSCPIRKLLAED